MTPTLAPRLPARDWAVSLLLHGAVLGALAMMAWQQAAPNVQRLDLSVSWAPASLPTAPAKAAPPPPAPVRAPAPPAMAQPPSPHRAATPPTALPPAVRADGLPVAAGHAPAPTEPSPAPTSSAAPDVAPTGAASVAPATAPAPDAAPPHLHPRWQQALETFLGRHKQYPLTARRARMEGKVMVDAHFDAQGILVRCQVADSSGFSALDDAATAMVHRAAEAVRHQLQPGRAVHLHLPIQFALQDD